MIWASYSGENGSHIFNRTHTSNGFYSFCGRHKNIEQYELNCLNTKYCVYCNKILMDNFKLSKDYKFFELYIEL